jgi:hypothetical protein
MKQSLLIGALMSSFGIFVSKLLGLLYYSPLSSIAGEENMAFYSIAYTYYDLLQEGLDTDLKGLKETRKVINILTKYNQ